MDDKTYAEEISSGIGGYISQFAQLGDTYDVMYSSEGLLSAMLGAGGGAGQHGLVSHSAFGPLGHETQIKEVNPETGEVEFKKDAKGNVMTRKMSAFEQENYENGIAFSKAKANILADLKYVNDNMNKLKKVVNSTTMSKGERDSKAQNIKDRMFNFNAYNTVRNGGAEFMRGSFNEILNTDNEKSVGEEMKKDLQEGQQQLQQMEQQMAKDPESIDPKEVEELRESLIQLEKTYKTTGGQTAAQRKGLSESKEDNEYKKTAQEALDRLNRYEKIYGQIMNEFDYNDDETAFFSRFAFNLKVQADSGRERVKKSAKRIKDYKESMLSSFEAIDESASRSATIADIISTQAKIDASVQAIDNKFGLMKDIAKGEGTDEYDDAIEQLIIFYDDVVKKHFNEDSTPDVLKKALIKAYKKDFQSGKAKLYDGELKRLRKKRDELMEGVIKIENNEDLGLGVGRIEDFQDLLNEEKAEKAKIEADIAPHVANLAEVEAALQEGNIQAEMLEKKYQELRKSKGRKAFLGTAKKYFNKLQEMIEDSVNGKPDTKEGEVTDEDTDTSQSDTKDIDPDDKGTTPPDPDDKDYDPFRFYNDPSKTSPAEIQVLSELMDSLMKISNTDGGIPMNEFMKAYNGALLEISKRVGSDITTS